jgi:uncharacterized membrane protein YphA (DoxX/SURF4 family)
MADKPEAAMARLPSCMEKIVNYVTWVARIVAAVILLQTLYFKFTASAESVYIFTTVSMEPWGRWLVGGLELVAGVLLLITPVAWVGAGLAAGLMLGAIGMHATILGIEVQNDGGYLFFLALVVLAASIIVFWLQRKTMRAYLQSVLFQRGKKGS